MTIPDSVADDEPLHRGILPLWVKENGQAKSAAFKSSKPISVDRAQYRPLEETKASMPGWGIMVLITKVVREIGYNVDSDKKVHNPAHALVSNPSDDGSSKRSKRAKKLRDHATWVLPLPSSQGDDTNSDD